MAWGHTKRARNRTKHAVMKRQSMKLDRAWSHTQQRQSMELYREHGITLIQDRVTQSMESNKQHEVTKRQSIASQENCTSPLTPHPHPRHTFTGQETGETYSAACEISLASCLACQSWYGAESASPCWQPQFSVQTKQTFHQTKSETQFHTYCDHAVSRCCLLNLSFWCLCLFCSYNHHCLCSSCSYYCCCCYQLITTLRPFPGVQHKQK